MQLKFITVVNKEEKSKICKEVLKDLPLWFGRPKANKHYCKEVKKYSFIKIILKDQVIGFISIKENSLFVSELYVLGILKKYHRQGIGTKAIKFIAQLLKKRKIKYLEVKTLDKSKKSKEYEKTRLFYVKLGFIPLDILENEWGTNNPALIMIKKL